MTLAVGIVTGDGLVIAADSRTSLTPPGAPYRVLSDYTHKVFQISETAVATYGFALLLGRNVSGHMGEFVRALGEEPEPLGPEEIATRLASYFGDLLDQHFDSGQNADNRPAEGITSLGFLVAGYQDGTGWLGEVQLPSREILKIADSSGGGAAWRGQTDVVTRLIKGYDGSNSAVLFEGLQEPTSGLLVQNLAKLEYTILWVMLNLQDAIDFAVLLIRTTIDVQRLTYGIGGNLGSWPGVGGAIEIAAVRPSEGFEWVQRTELIGEGPAGAAEKI